MRADIIDPVGTEQTGVHLLLRERGLPPAEKTDQLRAVRHRLQRPQPHHAGQWSRIVRRPVHRARLLLHHPPAALGTAPVEVMVKGRDVRPALPRVSLFVSRREPELFEEAERIAVPTRHIEVARHRMMVKVGKEPHEIMDDIARR